MTNYQANKRILIKKQTGMTLVELRLSSLSARS